MKALVCGAGISGLSAAVALSRSEWDVTVLERASGPSPHGYMIDFFGPGWQGAARMGILPRLHEIGYRVPRVDYVDRQGRTRASLDFAGLSSALDDGFVSVLRQDLQAAIKEALPAGVSMLYSATVSSVVEGPDGVRVTLLGGGELTADVLVGADGIHSGIRHLCFGPEQRWLRFLGFQVAAFEVDDPEVWAAIGNRAAATDTINEAMFFYRLREGRSTVMAVHRTPVPDRPGDLRSFVRSRYAHLGWICPAVLEGCPAEMYFDDVAQVRMPRWHTERTVLLGDAAGAVSLLAGQGASLGVAGAWALADELSRGAGIGAALAAFDYRWRPVVEEHQRAGVRTAKWFVPGTRRAAAIRRLALRLTKIPAVARLVGASITGKSGGLP